MTDILKALSKPFPVSEIHWRPGNTNRDKTSAIALAYVDARAVMDRLDDVLQHKWQCRYPYAGCCEIGISIDDEWIWRSDGAGQSNFEAEKGQFSDAFKRAAVRFGVGRYLYDVPNVWMPLENGKYFSKETISQLNDRFQAWQDKKYGH